MAVLRAIGNFFVRIGRWIKETAWVQPLLIVGGIFAIIFSIPYLTKWVKSWFNEGSAAVKYFSDKKVSLKNAEDQKSDVDGLFSYLDEYARTNVANEEGKKKYGEKFFLTLVQEDCQACEDRYMGFKTLEDNFGKGSFAVDSEEASFKFHTIFVDSKNKDGDNLFEYVYEKRQDTQSFFEETITYMLGEAGADHPYYDNAKDSSYKTNLENLTDREQISTPTTFLIDLRANKQKDWTSTHGVTEVLFSFDGTNGSDNYAKARTLFNCWTGADVFSENYGK